MYKMGITGLILRCWQDYRFFFFFLEVLGGKSVFLGFPAFRGSLHSLAHGPFHLQGWHLHFSASLITFPPLIYLLSPFTYKDLCDYISPFR